MENIIKDECNHWEDPLLCKDCNPPPQVLIAKRCDHKGMCLSDYTCPDTKDCCLLLNRMFHDLNECTDTQLDYACNLNEMKICCYHAGKVYYMFKKHEWDSY
jgi:hypothetical protein